MIVRATEGGASWSELAHGDPLAAVLDPADRTGTKNRTIDAVHKHALGRATGPVRGRAVLDFGCGTGRLAEWMVRRGAAVTGVDVTPEMVEVARRRVPEAHFEVIDGTHLTGAAGAFDLILSAYVLQYYLDGDGAISRELARVLAPGGRVLAIEQVADADLPRGGAAAEYARLFARAGLTVRLARPIRVGDSRIVAAVQARPWMFRLPGLTALIGHEARRSRGQLTGGRYADYLFVAGR